MQKIVLLVLLLLILLAFPLLALAQAHLKQVFVLARHGARAPLRRFPGDTVDYGEGPPGHLTPAGMRQTFELGRTLRGRYSELIRGFRDTRIYTSSSERCIQSAISHSRGLFGTDVLVPIRMLPDPIFRTTKRCTKFVNHVQTTLKSPIWLAKAEEEGDLLNNFDELALAKVSRLKSAIDCQLAQTNGTTLISDSGEFRHISEVNEWIKNRFYSDVKQPWLVAKMAKHMRREKHRYNLYSGHDTSLMAWQPLLTDNGEIYRIPEFADALLIEVYGKYVLARYYPGYDVFLNETRRDWRKRLKRISKERCIVVKDQKDGDSSGADAESSKSTRSSSGIGNENNNNKNGNDGSGSWKPAYLMVGGTWIFFAVVLSLWGVGRLRRRRAIRNRRVVTSRV